MARAQQRQEYSIEIEEVRRAEGVKGFASSSITGGLLTFPLGEKGGRGQMVCFGKRRDGPSNPPFGRARVLSRFSSAGGGRNYQKVVSPRTDLARRRPLDQATSLGVFQTARATREK